jgi:hypothetical protein
MHMSDGVERWRHQIDQFDRDHGGDGIEDDRWLLFADGAMRTLNQPGELRNPPTNTTELARVKLRYREAALREAQFELASSVPRQETPQESVWGFERENGNDGVVEGHWVLYSTGAVRERSVYGVQMPPPEDKYECAKNKVRYWEVRLDLAVTAFNDMRDGLGMSASVAHRQGAAPPSKEELKELRKLQREVRQTSRNLEAARMEVETTTPKWLKEHRASKVANQQAAADFATELRKIKI